MMYRIIPTARFRKEVKRAAKRGLPMERLEHVIDELAEGKTLAPQFRDHALTGDFAGYRSVTCSLTGCLSTALIRKF